MKTSVEWLIEVLAKQGVLHSSDIAKAKEMEKEQMFNFFDYGIDCALETGKQFEQYYNETFKDE